MIKRFFLAVVLLAVAPLASGDIGQVKTLTGEVFVLRGDDRLAATPGMRLQASDTVLTGDDSRIGITFVDNTRLSAGPNSRIELERFRFDPTTHDGEFTTRVEKGTLAIISGQIAKQSPDAMKVVTPTSVLAVRGTRFLVKVD